MEKFCLFWGKRSDKPGKRYVKQKKNDIYSILRAGQTEQAQTLLEFTLTLMALLLFTFGMIDFSRAVYTVNTIEAAAQAGARAGIVDMDIVEPTVQQKLVGLDLQKAHITTTLLSNGAIIEVRITYEFEFITPLTLLLPLHHSISFQASASMLIQ